MVGSVKGTAYAMVVKEEIMEDGTTALTYAPFKWINTKMAGTRELNFSPKGNFKEVWADGVVAYTSATNGGYEGTMTTIDLCDDINTDWYDLTIDEEGIMIEVAETKESPKFAILQLRESTTNPEGITEIYPYCYVTDRHDIKRKTKEDGEMNYEFIEHKLRAAPSPSSSSVRVVFPRQERFKEMPDKALGTNDKNQSSSAENVPSETQIS